MKITRLDIQNLRVIERLTLTPEGALNFIVGGNGAGKTSVLEAIYLAGRGRTFRHNEAAPLVRRGSDEAIVVARLLEEQSGREAVLGIRRGKKDFNCRLSGVEVKKRSTLAEALPVQWIGSQPQLFLDQGPDVRRRFIDMGLFHVEHDYLALYAETYRTLKQRNAALRAGDPVAAAIWDKPFALAAEKLADKRAAFISVLMAGVGDHLQRWQVINEPIGHRYRQGWSKGSELIAELERKIDLDAKMGFTSVGPQRAELELHLGGGLAEKTLSRGQQKMLMVALHLALIDEIISKSRARPILLVDDLAAELDERNQEKVLNSLRDREIQAFVTSIAEPAYAGALVPVFHVEHGVLRAS